MRFVTAPDSSSRFGIIVPRHSNTAVARNRLKRRLREIIRQNPEQFRDTAIDLVVFALPRAYAVDFNELRLEVFALYGRVRESLA